MTIAVSAVVNRSKWLFGAVTVLCACVIVGGCLIGFSRIGNQHLVERIAIAAICLAVAAYVYRHAASSAKVIIIHVSGTGQIRLSQVPNGLRQMTAANAELLEGGDHDVVQLLPISTLWSCLLILHLRHESGRTSIMTILPDSVSANSFRALLVAFRWIVMRRTDEPL